MDTIVYTDFFKNSPFFGNKSNLRKWAVNERYGKYTLLPYVKKWYYFGLYTPNHKEKYPYSSTILVFTTDGWHLCKYLMFFVIEITILILFFFFIEIELSIPYYIFGVIILKAVRGVGFNLFYVTIIKKYKTF